MRELLKSAQELMAVADAERDRRQAQRKAEREARRSHATKGIGRRLFQHVYTPAELELVSAWLDDTVSLSAVRTVMNKEHAIYTFLALGARELRRNVRRAKADK